MVYSRVGETVTADASIRNTPTPSFFQGYEFRQLSGSFNYMRNDSNRFIIITDNKIGNRYNTAETWDKQVYFPTNDYLYRNYNAYNLSNNRSTDFTSKNRWRYTFRDNSMTESNIRFSYTHDLKKSNDIISSMQDNLQTQSQNISYKDQNRFYTLEGSIEYF